MDDSVVLDVRRLLERIEHAAIATVSTHGQPWNTPVYFAREGERFYWTSRSDAQHSMNIQHNAHAFLVVYHSCEKDTSGAGVYVEMSVVELAAERDISAALRIIYQRRRQPEPPPSAFCGESPHRVYCGTAIRSWTNILHTAGPCPWDERVEITLRSL